MPHHRPTRVLVVTDKADPPGRSARVSTWLHQDLQHRLQHFGIPVTVVPTDPPRP